MGSLFSYAFRPFFLLLGLFAIVAMVIWLMALQGFGPAVLPVDVIAWHSHEMAVGIGLAAVAGFLLTAVSTWTGRPPVSGLHLMALVLAWLSGRVAMGFGGVLPVSIVFAVDMLFPILLFIYVAREVIGGGNHRNYPLVYLTAFLMLLNLLFHTPALGLVPLAVDIDRVALYLLVHMLLLMVSIIGGRIIPAFTGNWLRSQGSSHLPVSYAWLDGVAILATIVTGVFASLLPLSPITGVAALVAAIAHAARLSRWCGLATRREPLLFVLHVAYAWLPVGYLFTAEAVIGWQPVTVALHALTVGGVSFMILAVMTRVALGHTGRPLHAARLTVIAYWLMLASALARVLSALGSDYLFKVSIAGGLWIAAFALFIWVYAPILLGPRAESETGSQPQ